MNGIKTRYRLLLLICFTAYVFFGVSAQESPDMKAERMLWFKDARLGIFIHWGIYAVNGIDESWSFYNGYISYTDYMKQLKGFTAANYKPEEWASLIKESGAGYAVLTTKHHDGVALWDTKAGDLSGLGFIIHYWIGQTPIIPSLQKPKRNISAIQ
jgi:alpha-L-fucosidase